MRIHYVGKKLNICIFFITVCLVFGGFGMNSVFAAPNDATPAQIQDAINDVSVDLSLIKKYENLVVGYQNDARTLAQQIRDKPQFPNTTSVDTNVYLEIQTIVRNRVRVEQILSELRSTTPISLSTLQLRTEEASSLFGGARSSNIDIEDLLKRARQQLATLNEEPPSVEEPVSGVIPDDPSAPSTGGTGGGLGGALNSRKVDVAIASVTNTFPRNGSDAEFSAAIRGAVLQAGGSSAAANAAADAAVAARRSGGNPRAAAVNAAVRVDGATGSGGTDSSDGSGGLTGPKGTGNKFTGLENPIASNSFSEVLASVASFLALFGGAVSAIFILYGGFQMMTSGGDPAKHLLGRKTLLWAVVGLAILASVNKIIIPLIKELLLQ